MATYFSYQFSWLPIAAAIASNNIGIASVVVAIGITSVVVAIGIANVAIAIASVLTDTAIESIAIVTTSVTMAIAITALAPHIDMSSSSKCCIPTSVVCFYILSVLTIICI